MTVVEHVTEAQLMTAADMAHLHLRDAIAHNEQAGFSLAQAVFDAYESQAWMHDDGAHETRYRMLMNEKNLSSIFYAYCFEEFGLKQSQIQWQLNAGRLLVDISRTAVREISTVPNWGRFTERALRPLAKPGVVQQYEPDVLTRVLLVAEQISEKEAAQLARTVEPTLAPVQSRHVTEAMKQVGVEAPKRETDASGMTAEERKALKIDKAERQLRNAASTLLEMNQRAALRDFLIVGVRMLADQPQLLDKLTQAIEEARRG